MSKGASDAFVGCISDEGMSGTGVCNEDGEHVTDRCPGGTCTTAGPAIVKLMGYLRRKRKRLSKSGG